ncbi:ATP-dependent RNA helicase HrpA [Neptunicella sp. SCSIO 80796]|uniref:ATP-dependent RNA helicase HrpA n=1 Tax=Neptunicella plasticusilytica TaxID=3117012 RepID=UPI003A4E27C1
MSVSTHSLYPLLAATMTMHRHRFRQRIQGLKRLDKSQQPEKSQQLQQDIERSIQTAQLRQAQCPAISYPPLPVSEHKDELIEAIKQHQVVIIAGETGSGKTTQLPKICLEAGRGIHGLIGHTQPRRLAARTVANRIAEELQTPLGEKVGFKIRFSDQVSERSYIKLMTDGILLAEIQQDRFLNQYDTIIIDEAHERSLNIDFILGYLKQLLPKRPDLKLIITSATIDPERFARHFDDAPVFQVSGRTFPVEVRYRPLHEMADSEGDGVDQTQGIINAVDELSRESQGDILVFLSGEREIRDTADALNRRQLRHTEVVPLYARLSAAEQNRIFQSHAGRRIVLATNVAETSLTVPGIKYVIDPGTARISRYSFRSKVQRLPIEAISQASANQRSGRCGRVSAGICIRLYSEQDFLSRDEFTTPEILRTNLASVILQMLALGLGEIDQFPFVEAPDNRQINDGFRLLEEIQAITSHKGQKKLTQTGRQIARLPIDPRYARMVVQSAELGSLSEVLIIAAGMSIQDPRERPQDKRQAADQQHSEFADSESDFISLFNLWLAFRQQQKDLTNSQLRKWCKQVFINYLRMREWQDIVSQLKKAIAEIGFRLNSTPADYPAIHQALLSGLLSHIGNKEPERMYLGARNARFMIFPGSPLAKKSPAWVMVAELVETSRLFGRIAAKIQPEWIEPLASHLTKSSYSEPHWSKKRGAVMAYENVNLYGLPIVIKRTVNYSAIDPLLCRELFIQNALVEGDNKLNLPFLQHNQQLVDDIQALEDKSRRRDVLVDDQTMQQFYQQKLPEHICNEVSFRNWWKKVVKQQPQLLHFDPASLMKHDAEHVNPLNYPESWQQGNLHLPLDYQFSPAAVDDGVSILVPLPLLNQLQAQGFDWLVPGLRYELILNLIKLLPKGLRKNFVPAPNYAEACMADMAPSEQPFLQALSHKLKRMTGVEVTPDEWPVDKLPDHLKFNFKVLDNHKLVAQGRDLAELQHKLSDKVKSSLRQVATPQVEQKNLTEWSFGPLQQEFSEDRGDYQVKAYPALVDNGKTVAIKLFDQPHQAVISQQAGLRRLLRLNIPSPVKYLQEKLPNKAKLGLYFNPFGQIKALIDDCIDAAIDQLLSEKFSDIRDPDSFKQACDWVRAELNDRVLQIATAIEPGLTTAHQIKKKMKGNVPLNMISAHGDIQQQLNGLVFAGFVTRIGADKLVDWQRYIQGIERRLEKLPIDPNKDRLQQLTVEKVQQAIDAAKNKVPIGQAIPQEIDQARWMLEELRVSLFAQQLGTAYPVSEKRIINHLASF